MEQQQVNVEILTTDGDALLPRHKREARTEFQQETLEFAQNRVLEIALALGVAQLEEIQHIRIAEKKIWGDALRIAQALEVGANRFLWFFRAYCTKVVHKSPLGDLLEGVCNTPFVSTRVTRKWLTKTVNHFEICPRERRALVEQGVHALAQRSVRTLQPSSQPRPCGSKSEYSDQIEFA